MSAIGLDLGSPSGDLELVQLCADGDELAGRELLARHRDAVADSGPSPAFGSVDASGEQALVQLRNGSGSGLPFRVLWLTLHTQGKVPDDGERRNPVWDAFCALPLPAQTALWHHEVEGQEATAIAALLGTSTDEVRRHLVAAYATVRARVEQASPPSPSRGLASQLLLLQYSLRDVLAGVVLGPAAGRYLVARPRAGRRVPIEVTPTRRRSNAPYVALAAAVVGAVAATSFLIPAPVDRSVSPVPRAAPFEAPIVGSYLEAVAGTSEKKAPRQRSSQAVVTVAAAGSTSNGSTATAGGKTGGQQSSGGQNSGGPGPGPSGGGSPGAGGGSAPGGATNGPDAGSSDNGPGQGVQHASSQGASNGVRAHGPKNKGGKGGKSNAKGDKPGKPSGKGTGKASGKGKAAGRR